MLQVKEITKVYRTGGHIQAALDKVSLSFRKSEFVAILGHSGSGKTTFLNVVGGLDKYDQGDLIINGQSTRDFSEKEWDAYRNNSVGFVFQSYNLIGHLDIADNVALGMALSGMPKEQKHKNALAVLEKVGLKEHVHKRPNQLSGGQMQRVAIARALANDPDVILADEPTGALDSETSRQILDLIKDIAADKLVIMVTHNRELAEAYADRIIRFQDGKVVGDSRPLAVEDIQVYSKLRKTSMSFFTALKLSFLNIMTKKWRTAITALAASIGIIGIGLVLALSNGFNKKVDYFEANTLSNYPITINASSVDMENLYPGAAKGDKTQKFKTEPLIFPRVKNPQATVHLNKLSQEYMAYLQGLDQLLLDGISYNRIPNFNILVPVGGKVRALGDGIKLNPWPEQQGGGVASFLNKHYDLLWGSYPQDMTGLLLVIDHYNQLGQSALQSLGFDDGESIDFEKVMGSQLKLILNDDYYVRQGAYFTVNGQANDLSNLYACERAIPLTITGIVRVKEEAKISGLDTGLLYSDSLAEYFIADAQDSNIVRIQQQVDFNVLTGEPFNQNPANPMEEMMGIRGGSKEDLLRALGAMESPSSISLYPVNFEAKEKILAFLDRWNETHKQQERVLYTDLANIITSLSGNIMSAITIVLVAFAAISLVVSMIMIGIIIYISVLERTREIGVLRALGARKKDITRVFNAESFIIGSCAGIIGIGIALLLTIPANIVLYRLTELKNIAELHPLHAGGLVTISTGLTMLGGLIPAKLAAKKDPAEALRAE
jgi:ABC-type lipoprotein export system ATPase subunit/cell division protein FtsX